MLLGGFTSSQLILLVLTYSKVVRLFCFQSIKHQVNRVLELFIIFTDFHRIDELDQSGEVLLFHRCFIVDIADQCCVQQSFSLNPEVITGFTLALCVCNKRSDQLQNILFRVDIGKRVIVHGLLEIDSVENLDIIAILQKSVSALNDDTALRDAVVKIENGNVTHFLR